MVLVLCQRPPGTKPEAAAAAAAAEAAGAAGAAVRARLGSGGKFGQRRRVLAPGKTKQTEQQKTGAQAGKPQKHKNNT